MPKRKKGVDDLLRGVGETLGIIEKKPAVAKPGAMPSGPRLKAGPSSTSYQRHRNRRTSSRPRSR